MNKYLLPVIQQIYVKREIIKKTKSNKVKIGYKFGLSFFIQNTEEGLYLS